MLGVHLADHPGIAVTQARSLSNSTFTASEFRLPAPALNVTPMGFAIEYDTSALAHKDEGYHKGLKPRQLQMIAIGGAIGTGLFMGAGGIPRVPACSSSTPCAVCSFSSSCAHWASLCCTALRPDRSSPMRANSSVKRPLRGRVVQRAINSVVFRIAVFYVGSLVLLTLLLPYNAYKQGTSRSSRSSHPSVYRPQATL